MPSFANDIVTLVTGETKAIVNLTTVPPGVWTQRLSIQGNSLLSSLFVETLDPGATVLARYYDYGVGADSGERYDLGSHTLITAPTIYPIQPDRQIFTKLHNKPVLEVLVTGGMARLGVYASVVSTFASDLDNAIKKEGQAVDLAIDRGLPIMYYDVTNGQWLFARGSSGNIVVSLYHGTPRLTTYIGSTAGTVGAWTDLVTEVVPDGKVWHIHGLNVCSMIQGMTRVLRDGDVIGAARTSVSRHQGEFRWTPARDVTAGSEITLQYYAVHGPDATLEIFLQQTEEDA